VIQIIRDYYRNRPRIKRKEDLFIRSYRNMTAYSRHHQTLRKTFNNIFIRKIYDFESTNIRPYIIDGGANIGLGILYWKLKYPNAKILAFEPSQEVVKILNYNLKANNIKDVNVYQAALYDSYKTLPFTTNEGMAGTLIKEKGLEFNYDVETHPLSSYISTKVDLIKLDIEGSELIVLKEIRHKLHLVKRLFIEFHSFIGQPQLLSEVLRILEDTGFRYHIDTEYKLESPFNGFTTSLGQDLQLNIWAKRD
jgi:FkbM family methyltransferase